MNHRMNIPLVVYRVGRQKDADNLFSDRKSGKVADLKCFVVKTETAEKTDVNPVLYIIKKTIGVARAADVQLGDEIALQGRKYLVIDVNPRRYWKEIRATCEVKGSERS